MGQGNIHQDNINGSGLGYLHHLFHIFGMLDIQAAPLAEYLGKNASIDWIVFYNQNGFHGRCIKKSAI
jgi:hypothetical protein